MFFQGGARPPPSSRNPFPAWTHRGFAIQLSETPASPGNSGDIREMAPQQHLPHRPGSRRGPHLPPCLDHTATHFDATPLFPPGGRGTGGGIRAVHRILKQNRRSSPPTLGEASGRNRRISSRILHVKEKSLFCPFFFFRTSRNEKMCRICVFLKIWG